MSYGITRNEDGKLSYNDVVLPDGPWHEEADAMAFITNDGVYCIIRRADLGFWCGYVGVRPNHPWYGKPDGEIHAEVHGGVTWSNLYYPTEPKPIKQSMWWIGFDCGHARDMILYNFVLTADLRETVFKGDNYRTQQYAIDQTKLLAKQVVILSPDSGTTIEM